MRSLFTYLIFLLWAGVSPAALGVDLLQLYEQTLATNPALKGREYSIDQAKAQEDQALSKLLPQVAASGNLSWNEFTQTTTNFFSRQNQNVTTRYEGVRGIIQARQALFDLPSFLRFQSAGSTIQQTEQELEAARMAVSADLVDRYFSVLEAEDALGYLQGEKELTTNDMKRIRRMYERQMAMVTDVYEIEAYYQTLLTREIEVRNARAVALEKLRETAGIPVQEVAPLTRDRLPDVPGQAEEWVQEATRSHPTLLALEHAIEAAKQLIAGNRAEHLPQVELQLSQIYSDNGGFDNRQLPRYNIHSVGLQLNVPIFSGGGIEASVRDAIARHQLAIEKRTEKLREIERETRTAYLNAQTGRARVDSTGREVEAREKARAAQERSYELGVATIVALLESKKNFLKSRFEQAQARYDYIRSLVALRLWAGSLSHRDIEDINAWLSNKGSAP
jgi:outer membrane protein